ncbi:PucR family transcriptional regulator [Actinomadura fibrosa]|uniref:PucR family transcriptional regulator n=1 Tax=Actinomadura fibrosa TaxID=111802 RepID=A0ABW2Y0Q1_9ACTN|nr:helix-turn-helix domain-containing protein [Actinomadura fibrosa]
MDEVVGEIRKHVPEYAQPPDSDYGRRLRRNISATVGQFVDSLGGTAADIGLLTVTYRRLGAHEARNGRSLDSLQAAMRLGSQVACRRFIRQAYRLDWTSETLSLLTDSLFLLLEKAVKAAAEGYAAAQGEMATERERHRNRLRDLLVADPPTSREALVTLARAADWEPPHTIGVVALLSSPVTPSRVTSPAILADWGESEPYLVVPDPDGPGQDRLLSALFRRHPGVMGPTVPLNQGAVSLHWARKAARLMQRGVLPRRGVVRCVENLSVLAASQCEDLVHAASVRHLRPLLELPARRRETLASTLLTYLRCGENAITTAEQMHVHPQTIRYRVRTIQKLYGDEFVGPDNRLDMMLTLNAFLHFSEDGSAASR